MRKGIVFGLLTLALAAWAVPVRAELVVTVNDASVAQGSTNGTVDVYLSSNNTTGSDTFNTVGFQLVITNGPNDSLTFNSTQNFDYLNASNYVFSGNSVDWASGQSSPPPNGGSAGTTTYGNDTFTGFDQTNDLSTVSLNSSSTPLLLASLTLTATGDVGDRYTISLVPSSGNGSNDPSIGGNANTFFDTQDSSFNETAHVGFISNPGTITIVAASVPEPGSLVLGLSATAMLGGVGAVRRRRGRKGLAV